MLNSRAKYLRYAAVATLVLAALAGAMGRKEKQAKVTTGIRGKVEIWEGNFMPMVDPQNNRNKITAGADRTVRVYAPFKPEGGTMSPKLETVGADLVAETKCNKSGEFAVELPAGKYSVFVAEAGGWYANGFDSDGIQGAVEVLADSVKEMTIKITTKATF